MVSSWPMRWFASRCRATCATKAFFTAGAQIVPWLACPAMLLALVGNLYPVPEGPYGKLPYHLSRVFDGRIALVS